MCPQPGEPDTPPPPAPQPLPSPPSPVRPNPGPMGLHEPHPPPERSTCGAEGQRAGRTRRNNACCTPATIECSLCSCVVNIPAKTRCPPAPSASGSGAAFSPPNGILEVGAGRSVTPSSQLQCLTHCRRLRALYRLPEATFPWARNYRSAGRRRRETQGHF